MIQHRLVTLSDQHDLEAFCCGDDHLDGYLRHEACKAQRADTARTHVWESSDDGRVLAYFTISPAVVEAAEVGRKSKRETEGVSAFLLAKLALCQELRGHHAGDLLILDVLEVIVKASGLVGGRFIVVEAANNKVHQRYLDWDFHPVAASYKLWMSVSTARDALRGPASTAVT